MPRKTKTPAPATDPQAKPKKKRPSRARTIPRLKIGLPLGHPGRPEKYDEAFCPRVKRLALLGMPDQEIAHILDVSIDTFVAWKTKYPQFSEALNAGKSDADALVAQSLFERATGQSKRAAVKIFLDKDGNPVYAPYVETAHADVGAAKLWLVNRRPDLWRERREVEVTMTLEQRITQMSPEERLARLAELQAKAAALMAPTIDGEAEEVEE